MGKMIGRIFQNSKGQEFEVIEKATDRQLMERDIIPSPKKYYYVVTFTATGYSTISKDTNIRAGQVMDKTAIQERQATEAEKERLKEQIRKELDKLRERLPSFILFYYKDELRASTLYENHVYNAYTLKWALNDMLRTEKYKWWITKEQQPNSLRELVEGYLMAIDEAYANIIELKQSGALKGGIDKVKDSKKKDDRCRAGVFKALEQLEAAIEGRTEVKKVGRPRKERIA